MFFINTTLISTLFLIYALTKAKLISIRFSFLKGYYIQLPTKRFQRFSQKSFRSPTLRRYVRMAKDLNAKCFGRLLNC